MREFIVENLTNTEALSVTVILMNNIIALIVSFFIMFIMKLFIKSPIIRINTVFFKEIAIKNHSFYHEFTTFERALI